MTTKIGQQHTAGAYTVKRVSLRRVDLYRNGVLFREDCSRQWAFFYGFGDCAEFQTVFVGV